MAKKNKLTAQQRNKIADKLMLLGNIVFSAMIVAPIVSEQFSKSEVLIAAIGSITFLTMYSVAVWVMRGGASS